MYVLGHVRLCDTMDYSPPDSCVHGILQARILEWVAMLSSRGSSPPRDWTCVSFVSCIGRWILYHWATLEAPRECKRDTNKRLLLVKEGNGAKLPSLSLSKPALSFIDWKYLIFCGLTSAEICFTKVILMLRMNMSFSVKRHSGGIMCWPRLICFRNLSHFVSLLT